MSRRQKTQTRGPSTMITSREIRLKSRPVGMPNADNFELATVSVPHPAPGEVQVENLWMTVDPYMRNRMAHRASYAPSSQLGKELHGGAIGEPCTAGARPSSSVMRWRAARSAKLPFPTILDLTLAISSPPSSAGASGSKPPPEPCRSRIRSAPRPRHSWELPACQG